MLAFITSHIIELIFGLISVGLLGFCKYLHGQLKNYQALLNKEEDTELEERINFCLKPIKEEIDKIKKDLETDEKKDKQHLDLIIASYRFRLLQLCKEAIVQGFITQSQYDQLTEFYKIYHGLGGNGQTQEYYEKVMELDIRPEK